MSNDNRLVNMGVEFGYARLLYVSIMYICLIPCK